MVLASVCRSRIRLEGPNSIFQLERNRSGECKSIGGGLLRILQIVPNIVPNARHPLFSLIAYAYFKFLQFEGCVCVCVCVLFRHLVAFHAVATGFANSLLTSFKRNPLERIEIGIPGRAGPQKVVRETEIKSATITLQYSSPPLH